MLLTGYTKNITRPFCMPGASTLHCVADLNEDISAVLPYLNAVLGGYGYVREPASVTFQLHGKLLTVHARQVAVNALKDEDEAENVMKWLMNEINDAWASRDNIEPKYEDPPKPTVVQVLKYLPHKTSCGECGLPTCMVFATRATIGVKDANDCPQLTGENKEALARFLSGFVFEE